jgi:hypothetical protein
MVQPMSSALRRSISLLVLPALVFTTLHACTLWKPVPQRLVVSNVSVEVPTGWMRLRTPTYEMLSKDGPYLQYVLVQAQPVDHRFRFTQRKLTPHMLPHEAAQVILANLASDPQLEQFTLISNEPAALNHKLGFKLIYTHTDPFDVELRTIYLGAINGDVYFHLRYTAASRHYFSKDLSDFEQIHRSLRILPSS